MTKKVRNYDKKIFRLIFLLNQLDRGQKLLTRTLANEFNVSQRSVQRDIELLNMTGFPLVSLEDGSYSFEEGFSLKKMMLSDAEASLLSCFYEMTRSLGGNFEDSFRSILCKILTQKNDSPFYVKMPEGLKIEKDYPFLKTLEEAITTSIKVMIRYDHQGTEKDFTLCPLKMIFFDGFWYLLANPEDKKWLIKFRLEKIKNLKILEEHFEPPANLKTVLDESVNIRFSERRDIKVVLKISGEVSRYFKQRTYLPLQKIKKENKDRSLIIECKISQHLEIMPVIFRWIPYVEVISPADLSREVKKEVKLYLDKL